MDLECCCCPCGYCTGLVPKWLKVSVTGVTATDPEVCTMCPFLNNDYYLFCSLSYEQLGDYCQWQYQFEEPWYCSVGFLVVRMTYLEDDDTLYLTGQFHDGQSPIFTWGADLQTTSLDCMDLDIDIPPISNYPPPYPDTRPYFSPNDQCYCNTNLHIEAVPL